MIASRVATGADRLVGRQVPDVRPPTRRARVSVVVPCYNYGRYLPVSVGSVLDQEGVDVDVLVIDDASPDGSGAVAEQLASADERVAVIRHERNAGHIATYNEGLARAAGNYVVLLSADDALAPGALLRATSLLEAEPGVGFTYGPVTRFCDDLPSVSADPDRPVVPLVWSGSEWLARRCRLVTNCVISPEVVMRREVYERVGPYDPALPYTGDMALWMLAASIADVGYLAGATAAFYRVHGNNMTFETFRSGEVEGMLVELGQRRTTIEAVFAGAAAALPNAGELERSARAALAGEALGVAARAYTWGLTQEWPVDGLVEFAAATYDGHRSLWQWRALRRRRALGATLSRKLPPFLLTELVLRAQRDRRRRIEQSTGA